MKESHLYERSEQMLLTKKQSEVTERNSVTGSLKAELMESMFKMMELLVQGQERIQILKEMLTERTDFSPQPLFYWVSRNESQLDKKHLLSLFEQNQFHLQEDYIKLYFNSYGFKQKIDYSAFINLIFPQNTDLIKYISVTGIKRYSNNSTITEDVLCIFLNLVQEEVQLLERLDGIKNELLPKITRKEIKHLMRIMKKNGDCNSLMEIDSRPFVKYEELKTLFKNCVAKTSNKSANSVNSNKKATKKCSQPLQINENTSLFSYLERNSLSIFRRLSMGKTNFINLEDFEFWFRPWNKQRSSLNVGEECASNIFTISGIDQIDNESKVSLGENISLPLSHTGK